MTVVVQGPLTLKHEDDAADANRRLVLPHNRDLVLVAGQWVELAYDPSLARWLVVDNNVTGLERWATPVAAELWN